MRSSHERRRLLPAALWTMVIAIGLFLPAHLLPAWWVTGDTLAHVVLFAGAALLWLRAVPHRAGAVLAVLAVSALAAELWQGANVPGRSAQWGDVGANLGGMAIGWGLARLLRR